MASFEWPSLGSGGSSMSYPLLAPNGSAAVPTYSFAASSATGMYSSGSNTIDWSINGVDCMQLGSGSLSLLNSYFVQAAAFIPTGSASIANGINLVSANSLGFYTNSTLNGSVSSAGVWTLGASASTANHIVNGTAFVLQAAASGTTEFIVKNTGSGSGINGSAASAATAGANSTYAYNLYSPSAGSQNWFSGNIGSATAWSVNFGGSSGNPVGSTSVMSATNVGDNLLGLPSLATTATAGRPYMPLSAGAPTGVPTAVTGMVPFQYDTTNHKLWVFDSGTSTWKGIVLT